MSTADVSYDHSARRDTPLAKRLAARIRATGPLPVADYIHACLHDPDHGYYRHRAALGRDGDFITAPEISQVFGELIGLWCVVVWEAMGSPPLLRLVEIGPGRGTLMRDALRAARLRPAFGAAVHLHLVETDAALRTAQASPPMHERVTWHMSLADVPAGPTILIANEFLDTLPVAQHVALDSDPAGAAPVLVGLDTDGRLMFGRAGVGADPAHVQPLPAGAPIHESQDLAALEPLRARATTAPLAALMLDYGTTGARPVGDSLQAVRAHRFEHPLTSPGEADLSVMVDFAAVARSLAGPLVVDGPVTQAQFLGTLGILERASRLMAANPVQANAIETGVARLLAPVGMGTRFQALAARTPDVPPLPGLAALAEVRRA